jgi:hypothetical protein
MARWLVELNGDPFDVNEFLFCFPNGDAYAIAENRKVFLTGGVFDKLTEPSQVHETAEHITDEYFAIISLLQYGFKKPSIGVVFREADDGNRKGFAISSGVASGRSKARSVSGEQDVQPRSTQAQELLSASRSDRRLQVAVSLVAVPGATWPHLYRCLEEIEHYLGKKASEAGLCSGNQRERFTRTANTAEVAGRDARHRLGKFDPPSDPMPLHEARTFILQTLQATLRTVAAPPPRESDAV